MTNGFYKKTPSLSLRLRLARVTQLKKRNSNNLERHSSSFELIRVLGDHGASKTSNELELSRICSNNLERGCVTDNG